jgi:hypothetical protein
MIRKLLSSGYMVELRPTPPYVVSEVYRLLPEPEMPSVVLESPAGSETHKPLPGDPKMVEWQRALTEWQKQTKVAAFDFTLQYGVVRWFRVGGEDEEDGEWQREPPPDWQVPEELVKWGLYGDPQHPFDDRRLRFIKIELIQTDPDADAVYEVVRGRTQPITEEEVKASLAPFDSLEETATLLTQLQTNRESPSET